MIIDRLMHSVSPSSHWHRHLCNLFEKYSEIPDESMGFMQDWRNDPFWEA
jgi:hypothetical protein